MLFLPCFCSVLILCAVTDAKTMEIPPRYPLLVAACFWLNPMWDKWDSFAGFVLCGGILFCICLFREGAFGGGDIKLCAAVGFTPILSRRIFSGGFLLFTRRNVLSMNLKLKQLTKNRLLLAATALALSGGIAFGIAPIYQKNAMETIQVVCVDTDVGKGEQLLPEVLKIQEIPREFLPEGVVQDTTQTIGRYAAVDLQAGDWLTQGK